MNFIELAHIVDIKETNVEPSSSFDFFRTHKFEGVDETSFKNMLYFLSYSTYEEELNEWCNHFDLRKTARERMVNILNATFVIEKEQKIDIPPNAKYILVDSVRNTIDILYKHKVLNRKPQVIGVTGSVGKTTCVGIIEQLLRAKYKVLRIYSSRINPFVLQGHLLNYLDDTVNFIVMEYSIFSKNHVAILANMLQPSIAIVLNVTTEHIGKQGLDTLEDIVKGKLAIFEKSNINFLPKSLLEYATQYQNVYLYDNSDCLVDGDGFIYKGIAFKPFFNTDLSIQQYIVAIEIALLLKINQNEIQTKINQLISVEHRFLNVNLRNKPITFIGETIHNSRLATIADTKAKDKVLIIRKLGAKSTYTDAESLIESIVKFRRVYVFNDIGDDYISIVRQLSNVELVSEHSFIENIEDETVYIYSGYFNTHKMFDVENLNVYNDSYPVKGIKK